MKKSMKAHSKKKPKPKPVSIRNSAGRVLFHRMKRERDELRAERDMLREALKHVVRTRFNRWLERFHAVYLLPHDPKTLSIMERIPRCVR